MVSESLKRAIKKWNDKNRDKFLGILKKNSNNYYIKNKEKVKERNSARYKFGTEFYLMCNMYTNLIE